MSRRRMPRFDVEDYCLMVAIPGLCGIIYIVFFA